MLPLLFVVEIKADDLQFLLGATSIVGTPVLRTKTINIWYDCIIKLMNILSGRPEWIFPTGDQFVRRDTDLYYGRSICTTDEQLVLRTSSGRLLPVGGDVINQNNPPQIIN